MNWVALGLAIEIGVPVIAIAGLAAFGMFVERKHRVSRSVRYAARPETIWRLISDWRKHPEWRSRLRAVDRLPNRNGHEVWREFRRNGSRQSMELTRIDPAARRMVAEIVDKHAYSGRWIWEVEPVNRGDGAVLSITEDGEISNPIFRAISAWFLDKRSMMDRFHRDLKAALGEAEPVFEPPDGNER